MEGAVPFTSSQFSAILQSWKSCPHAAAATCRCAVAMWRSPPPCSLPSIMWMQHQKTEGRSGEKQVKSLRSYGAAHRIRPPQQSLAVEQRRCGGVLTVFSAICLVDATPTTDGKHERGSGNQIKSLQPYDGVNCVRPPQQPLAVERRRCGGVCDRDLFESIRRNKS